METSLLAYTPHRQATAIALALPACSFGARSVCPVAGNGDLNPPVLAPRPPRSIHMYIPVRSMIRLARCCGAPLRNPGRAFSPATWPLLPPAAVAAVADTAVHRRGRPRQPGAPTVNLNANPPAPGSYFGRSSSPTASMACISGA